MKLFTPDHARYEGVRPVHILMLRALFTLIFLFVGFDTWSAIAAHTGEWNPLRAAALSMFAAYSLLAGIGILRPLRMLPIMVFVCLYKSIWLFVVAYPLWAAGTLAGSPAESMARIFVWVPVAIVAVPWRYFLATYVLRARSSHAGRLLAP